MTRTYCYGIATYRGEEIDVHFSAAGVKADYGVPGSPRWVEWENVEIESIEMFGFEIKPAALQPELVQELHALADGLEFEADDR